MTKLNLNEIEKTMQNLRNLNIELNHTLKSNKHNVKYDDVYYLVAARNSEAFKLTKLLIKSNKDAYEIINDYWHKFENDTTHSTHLAYTDLTSDVDTVTTTTHQTYWAKPSDTSTTTTTTTTTHPTKWSETPHSHTDATPTTTQTHWSETSHTDATPTTTQTHWSETPYSHTDTTSTN